MLHRKFLDTFPLTEGRREDTIVNHGAAQEATDNSRFSSRKRCHTMDQIVDKLLEGEISGGRLQDNTTVVTIQGQGVAAAPTFIAICFLPRKLQPLKHISNLAFHHPLEPSSGPYITFLCQVS